MTFCAKLHHFLKHHPYIKALRIFLHYNCLVIIYLILLLTLLQCQYQSGIQGCDGVDCYYPRLRDMREDNDLSQEAVAAYLGMKQPQYSRYERGLRDIPTDALIRLAMLYKTSTDYLLGLTSNPAPYTQK